jgi:hypothetical protein
VSRYDTEYNTKLGFYWKILEAWYGWSMQEALDVLEERIAQLRRAVRTAIAQRDSERVTELRAELRRAERAWDALVTPSEPEGDKDDPHAGPRSSGQVRVGTGSLLPAREQVHQVLTLLGVPAAPKLIGSVHAAFFAGELTSSRLTSLRRDEERSYRSAPNARPYYLCPALTADLLSPARGLLTVSTWRLHQRVVGPLSPRVDFLKAAIRIAETMISLAESADDAESSAPQPTAERLLWRFAANIPGANQTDHVPREAAQTGQAPDPYLVRAAAQAELDIHADADSDTRAAAAQRAGRQLSDFEQLFGTRLKTIRGSGTGT